MSKDHSTEVRSKVLKSFEIFYLSIDLSVLEDIQLRVIRDCESIRLELISRQSTFEDVAVKAVRDCESIQLRVKHSKQQIQMNQSCESIDLS